MDKRIAELTCAHLADACLRAGLPVRCAPAGTRALVPGTRLAGPVRPARHAGSVDVFLEALTLAAPGEVLVVDNAGRLDESCVGDLVALEARAAGLAGLLIWGLHRDSADLRAIGLPVFSLGSLPTGPLAARERAADALSAARVGEWTATTADYLVADEDGALLLPADRLPELLELAEAIRDTERRQAELIHQGRPLREQVGFDAFLAARAAEPALTFREHLRRVGGAIEE
ncbi:dimethylmenaquinone methyltransferase [Streptomyces tateyamensis]|uniref:Putative 4-hydroxy-4-methyl-2-oxoglutarate aldolase n=1 Tax=Streptomyces tateyamensis TaxID=565073 RepID=A0A2V4N3G9_9ACTN|nr:RraA family protein [Streptomyces tateyamensis]PYC78575.1 dimethylmenaquinone methyltransferase [Streptomyces tateyamensis]